MDDVLPNLSSSHQELISLLRRCVEQSYREQYREALQDFENGVVSKRTMPYLVKPDDILVGKTSSHIMAYKVISGAQDKKTLHFSISI